MAEIIRNEPLYKQVAAVVRQAIADGEYPPGSPLPSEAELSARYRISRPTVRQALAALRSEGLIEVIMGKGSFVRATANPAAATTVERTVKKTGTKYTTPQDGWTEDEPPNVYRTDTDATTGPLLGMDEDESTITVDRTLTDPATGTRYLHRLTIPLATAAGTDVAEDPTRPISELYAILAASGYALTWDEAVSARMPLPDERNALRIPEATPLLTTYRVTSDRATGKQLVLEELRSSAGTVAMRYHITAGTDPGTR